MHRDRADAPPPDCPWQAFGARLRHWRRRAGLTQARLAAVIGYDHTAISKLEHGTRRADDPPARCDPDPRGRTDPRRDDHQVPYSAEPRQQPTNMSPTGQSTGS